MDRLYAIVGWLTLGFGCFTLSVVMSPRHSGWPTSLLLFLSSHYQLPAQESTAVQLGIAALTILYLVLLVARRWVR